MTTGQDKIAMLLMSLAPDAAEGVLARLGPDRAGTLRGHMQRLSRTPPATHIVEEVLREFEEVLRSATLNAAATPRLARGTEGARGRHEPDRPAKERRAGGPEPAEAAGADDQGSSAGEDHCDDPIDELRLLDAGRLGAALAGEHPRTVAMVLDCLDAKRSGDVLRLLPPEVRPEVFVRLGQPSGQGTDLIPRIIRAVVEKSRSLPEGPADQGDDVRYRKMAEVLRSLDRTARLEMLAALEEHNAQAAAMVKDHLYLFEDLLLIENRSMQKLLAEVDSKIMAMALKNADEMIVEKVLSNLSKRARDSLSEEMGFLGAVAPAKVLDAQKTITDVIQRLDQAGELVMQEQTATEA